MKKKAASPLARLLRRYRAIPKQLHSPSVRERSKAQRLIAATICLPLMLVCAGYILSWHAEKARVEADNAAYEQLYVAAAPTAQPSQIPSPTPLPSPEPTAEIAPSSTSPSLPEPSPTPAASQPASAEPSQIAQTAQPAFDIAVDATRVPHPTPDADTLVISLETPPPVQQSFQQLLEANEDTIGYLTIDSLLSLPVVQRKNDNSFYLDHSFDGSQSNAGTLFLDGANLLVPEDKNLIIYGHNMRNGTMFHSLIGYEKPEFLIKHPLVQFDTLYENRTYVPFAAFTATVEPGSERYLDIRQFIFDEDSFELFISKIQRLSLYDSPVEVVYGDHVLLLVTCEYIYDNGRFVVALREMRDGETEVQMRELARYAKLK